MEWKIFKVHNMKLHVLRYFDSLDSIRDFGVWEFEHSKSFFLQSTPCPKSQIERHTSPSDGLQKFRTLSLQDFTPHVPPEFSSLELMIYCHIPSCADE
jgi:hypothetical protein